MDEPTLMWCCNFKRSSALYFYYIAKGDTVIRNVAYTGLILRRNSLTNRALCVRMKKLQKFCASGMR